MSFPGTVHFVHIGDSHVRVGGDDAHLARLHAAVAEIGRLRTIGVPVDFVVHTGDLADAADEPDAAIEPTRRGIEALSALGVPWYVLGGNHDRRAYLQAVAPPDACVSVAYPGVECRTHGALDCLFVDANPEDGVRDLHGAIADVQVGVIGAHLDALASGRRVALFLHYPPREQQGSWTGSPAGGDALHAALASRAARVAGVFAGHVHRGVSHLVDGLLYTSVPALSRGFALWPGLGHAFDDLPTVPYHYVAIGADGTRVQAHAFVPPGLS